MRKITFTTLALLLCGAVSGMVLVANMLYGYESPTDNETKMAWYKEIQSIVLEFKARNGL